MTLAQPPRPAPRGHGCVWGGDPATWVLLGHNQCNLRVCVQANQLHRENAGEEHFYRAVTFAACQAP